MQADNRTQYAKTYAYLYGPVLLAGLNVSSRFVPRGTPDDPASFMTRTESDALTFRAVGQVFWHNASFDLIPLFQIMTEGWYMPAK